MAARMAVYSNDVIGADAVRGVLLFSLSHRRPPAHRAWLRRSTSSATDAPGRAACATRSIRDNAAMPNPDIWGLSLDIIVIQLEHALWRLPYLTQTACPVVETALWASGSIQHNSRAAIALT